MLVLFGRYSSLEHENKKHFSLQLSVRLMIDPRSGDTNTPGPNGLLRTRLHNGAAGAAELRVSIYYRLKYV